MAPTVAPYPSADVSPIPAVLAVALLVTVLVLLLLAVLTVAGMWRTLTKAGQPGWASIVPLYGVLALLRAGGRSDGWLLLALLPASMVGAQVVIALHSTLGLVSHLGWYEALMAVAALCGLVLDVVIGTGLALMFGRGTTFGVVALGLLPFIGYPALGFGGATHARSADDASDAPAPPAS